MTLLPLWVHALESRALAIAHVSLASTRAALHFVATRTGLPVFVVAALALVLAWRVARRTWAIALELALAVAALVVATHLGWIRW